MVPQRRAWTTMNGHVMDRGETVMPVATAFVTTDRAGRYVKQLVGHFSHRTDSELDDTGGTLRFDFGVCTATAADDGIRLEASAGSAEDLDRLEDVVARHLVRFGAKDELVVTWSRD
jgi:hypothetical protein